MARVKAMKLESVGHLVKRVRKKQALSLRAVAKRARVTAQTVMLVERGRGSIDVSLRVMKVLGVSRTLRAGTIVADVQRIAFAA